MDWNSIERPALTKADLMMDDIAKAAYLLPRRKALAFIFKTLGGAALAAIFVGKASAVVAAGCGEFCKLNGSGPTTCPAGMHCRDASGNSICLCDTGACCCTSTKACLASVGGSGDCRAGFSGC